MKKLSAYIWAFIALIVVFFTAGVATLGTAATSGKSTFIHADEKIYFSLLNADGASNSENVKDVYVKIGSVYNEVGEEFTLNVALSTSQTPTSSTSTYFTKAENVVVNNVYSEKDGVDGANYNWLKVVSNWGKSAKTIYFSSTANLELYEIVCLNENGERIGIKAFNNALNPYEIEEASYACDAQESVILSENAYYNLTAEEGYYLASAQT